MGVLNRLNDCKCRSEAESNLIILKDGAMTMTTLEQTIPHSLGKKEARMRIQTFLSALKDTYGQMIQNLYEDWDGEVCRFSFDFRVLIFINGHISGQIVIGDSDVSINGEGPDSISAYKGRIEHILWKEGRDILQ